MTKKLYNDIIATIPSPDLLAYIKRDGFRFGETKLLKIIDVCARTFDEKLDLFERASREFENKRDRAHAKKLVNHNKRQYDEFMRADDNCVYETDIKCEPDDKEDTIITKTFDDAVQNIKMYIRHYADVGIKDGKYARYIIRKKTATVATRPSDIGRDKVGTLGECVLGQRFKILDLSMYGFGDEKKCKSTILYCEECENPCVFAIRVKYPHFLKKYDLVAYQADPTLNPRDISYGILGVSMDDCDDDSYVIKLDNKYIKNRNAAYRDEDGYYRIYDAHWHPYYCQIFKPDIGSLPDGVYDDYLYAVEELKKIDEL